MTIVDGWFDWAIKSPGPSSKTGYAGLPETFAQGVVYHSAEGYEAALLAALNDPNRIASWTASNLKDGRFLQHYPVNTVVWTNGSKQSNSRYRGVESEGVVGEALTAKQTANLIRCAKDMAEWFHWPRIVRREQLWEHNEMTAFGSAATACPSGRIPWPKILAGLQIEEDDMFTDADRALLAAMAKRVETLESALLADSSNDAPTDNRRIIKIGTTVKKIDDGM